MPYEDVINAFDIPYGIEIEFSGTYIYDVDKKLMELLGTKYLKYGSSSCFKWCLKDDYTVQYQKCGGEVNTPIMHNTKKDWEELKRVCELLKSFEDIEISENCSIHIHIDKRVFDNVDEYVNLLKIWMVYEDIIYRFGYGEMNHPRYLLFRYARPQGYYIYDKLYKIENVQVLDQLLTIFDNKFVGLNLTHKDTIENRIFNGTLNESIIQNEVLFTLNLIKSAKSIYFDKEFIDYKVKNYKTIFINDSMYENDEKVKEFANLIYNNEHDKQKFYTQYYKNMI